VSIRLRLTLWHTALLALTLTGFAVVVYAAVERQLTNELNADIQLRALQASRALRAGFGRGPSPRGPRLDLPDMTDSTLYVQMLSPRGDVLERSANLPRPLPIPPESLRLALEGQEVHDTLSFLGGRVELYTAPLLIDGGSRGVAGVLQVAAPLEPLRANLAQLRTVLVGVVLGGTSLAAAAGWFLVSQALRPVDRMTQTAHAIGLAADFSKRLPDPPRRDELGRLAETFNQMLARLDAAFTTQRRFLADAAHELRTPLTAVRTDLEALRRGADRDPVERDATLREAVREVDRMGRLVGDLLALARADAGQALDRRPLPLDTLLIEVYQKARTLANGVELSLGELEQVEVEGDRDRLEQLLLNLVDNALRYTPPGGLVTLELVARAGWARLRVRDTGPGIPADHLPRIFERFYRIDQARSPDAGGTGLGLAIGQWIARAHGGRIEVESREGAGSTFTVLLPAAGGVGDLPATEADGASASARAPGRIVSSSDLHGREQAPARVPHS